MADAAVRVDIIVGQNTVIKSTELTGAALTKLSGVSTRMNGGFENLSRGGLRKLEVGFRSLAFQAAGVSGPMGKIAEGAVLLGGGSGVLLGVAVAAGTLGLAWKTLTTASTGATAAMERLKVKLTEVQQILADVKTVQDDIAKNDWWRNLLVGASASVSALRPLADAIIKTQAALIVSAEEGARLAREAHNKAIVDRINLLNKEGKAEGDRLLAMDKAAAAERKRAQQELLQRAKEGIQFKPGQGGLAGVVTHMTVDQMVAYVTATREAAEAVADWGGALKDVGNAMVNGESGNWLLGHTEAVEKVGELYDALAYGMAASFEAIGASLVGAGNFGKAMVDMFRSAIVALARMNVAKELASAATAFASGTWPPNPLAIKAGVGHLKAAALWGVAGGVAASIGSSGGVGGRTASGGVNGGQFAQDQQQMARGTVTVKFGRGGFIDPRSPEFQEFMADVFREARGRNVVFA